jgi:nicotinamide mononucleotide adenylyltransferase
MSKGSGRCKDLETLKIVLRSKYPHPILNLLIIGSSEERRSRENHFKDELAQMVQERLDEDLDDVPQDDQEEEQVQEPLAEQMVEQAPDNHNDSAAQEVQ